MCILGLHVNSLSKQLTFCKETISTEVWHERHYEKNIFYYFWAQPESYLMVTTFPGRLLIQRAPLRLSPPSPTPSSSTKVQKYLWPPVRTPRVSVQCVTVNKNWGKTPGQEAASLFDRSTLWRAAVTTYAVPLSPFWVHQQWWQVLIIPFWTLRFQGYFWSSNALKSMCKYRGHCQAKKKVRHTSPRPNCFGHDHDSQFHFQMLPEPSQKSFGDD